MTVYRLQMTVGTGDDARQVAVEVEAASPAEAVASLGTRGVRVNEHGATYVSPLAGDVSGGTVYQEWTVDKVTPSKATVTTEYAARRLQEMRDAVQDGPDHGVRREDAEALLEGMTAEQIREVAARGPLPAGYQQTKKEDLVRHTVSMTVGSALDHRAIVGYPEKDIAPEWTQSDSNDERRSPMIADRAPAVRWTDPKTGTRHVGVVTARDDEHGTATIVWDNDRVEENVSYTDPKVVFLPEGHPDATRAQAEATQRAEARAQENERLAGTSFPERKDPMEDFTPDPFGGDTERKRTVEKEMRDKIRELQGAPGEGPYYVGVKELRDAMPGLSEDEFTAAAENVFSHTDVFPTPGRSGAGTDEEQDAAAVQHGGPKRGVHILTPEEADRQRADDPQRWNSASRDEAESYFATLNERELSNLARRLDLDDTGTEEELRERLAGNAAANHREWAIRAHEETEDLKALHAAEQAMQEGQHPGDWTEEERAKVGAAARRQADNEWEPGRKRAEMFDGLPEDGTLGEKWGQYAKDQDEIRDAKKEASETGQAYIDHIMEGSDPCAAGRRHAGPCVSNHVTPEHHCTLCGGDVDLVDMTTTAGGHMCRRCIADRAAYAGQPHDDWTGVPGWIGQRCPRCRQPMDLVKGSQHFDADGGASINTRCPRCHIESGVNWVWSTGEAPANDHRTCEECGMFPGHSQHCPLNGQEHNVLRVAKADDGAVIKLVRDDDGYAVEDSVCGFVTSAIPDDRDSIDGDFDHHLGWHNAENAREANRGKADDGSQIERTTTTEDGVVIQLVRTASAAGAESGRYVVHCEADGQVTDGPLEDAERMNGAFDNHVALHAMKKAEADAKPPVQPYAGTKEQLELKYDDIVRLHEEMYVKLDARQEKGSKGSYEIEQCRYRVEDIEAHDGSLRDAAATLMTEMQNARFDTSSIAGVEAAAEAVDPDGIADLIDHVDITSDYMTEHFDRTAAVMEEIRTSLKYVMDTYGALAAGIQETGVSGKVLEGTGA